MKELPAKVLSYIWRSISPCVKPLFCERFQYDAAKGFYINKHGSPLCPACLAKSEATYGPFVNGCQMICPIHGKVYGANFNPDNAHSQTKIVAKTIWISPKRASDKGIMPLHAESIEKRIVAPIAAKGTPYEERAL